MNELYHHGVKGMKWGVRRTPEQLGYDKNDSSVTKRVKKDYNSMSDQDFMNKYSVSKKTYAKRVDVYGDPYTNSPAAKLRAKSVRNDANKNVSTKQLRQERRTVGNKEYNKLVKEYGIKQKEKDALEYGKKT